MARSRTQSVPLDPASPPSHLSDSSQSLWRALIVEYSLENDTAAQAILRAGLEARDRLLACQEAIARDGLTTVDRFGQTKPHPLIPAERDSRAQFLAALKQLNLDLEPLRDSLKR